MDHRADRSGALPFSYGLTSLTVLDVQKGSHQFVDAFGVRCTGKTALVPMSTIVNGKILYNQIESDYRETALAASARVYLRGWTVGHGAETGGGLQDRARTRSGGEGRLCGSDFQDSAPGTWGAERGM